MTSICSADDEERNPFNPFWGRLVGKFQEIVAKVIDSKDGGQG